MDEVKENTLNLKSKMNKTADIITLDHRLLQIGEFTFFYKGVLEAIFLNAKFENDKQ